MTKCIVLGQSQEKKKVKPIEFMYWLKDYKDYPTIHNDSVPPSSWDNIELVALGTVWDTMYAYNTNRNHGTLYLGKWNDGFVK